MNHWRLALRISLFYLLLGATWILVSDRALAILAPDPGQFAMLQTYKGWFYVVVTSLPLFWIVNNNVRRIEALNRDLDRRVTERTRQLDESNRHLSEANWKLAQANEELAATNEQLEESNRRLGELNRELEAFSYSVSHDLRAPLRAVNGLAELLEEDYAPQLDADAAHSLQLMRKSAAEMDHLVVGLLAFSHSLRQPVRKESVQPADVVQDCLSALRAEIEERGVQVVVDALPECRADPLLLRQVYMNLLSNALKFTRQRAPARIEVGYEAQNGRTVYWVRDNGIGFDMRHAERLFGVFQRLHGDQQAEGSGVGLAIVQRIIRRHGGQVWAQSAPGQGATFYFSLE